jgi:hypothetical protein
VRLLQKREERLERLELPTDATMLLRSSQQTVARLGHWPKANCRVRRHASKADEPPAQERKAAIESSVTSMIM